MPANPHDQPAEGGVEAVENTLRKQSEPKENKKPVPGQQKDERQRSDKADQK